MLCTLTSSMDFIFIHGAPGSGKSTLAWALRDDLQSSCFEFGWIPEFRVKRDSTITQEEEKSLAFENLTLVIKNHVRHGFENHHRFARSRHPNHSRGFYRVFVPAHHALGGQR
jgi:adenylate kinase family enzyme